MRYIILLFLSVTVSWVSLGQETDSTDFCQYPDKEAKPPYRMTELLDIILDECKEELPECFNYRGQFFFNIVVRYDGTVDLLNLECVNENGSTYLNVQDLSKLKKWTPATQDGINCTQKMRIKAYIHFR